MDILRTEGLTRQYGTGQTMVTALDHVDLQVERGQFVAIIGASGSGKSTLLHLLGGVDRPDGGKIFVEDVDIATFGEERLAQYRRRKVGLIYQFYNLIPTLSVKKNICLPMLLDNKEPGKERFDDIVRTLGQPCGAVRGCGHFLGAFCNSEQLRSKAEGICHVPFGRSG